LIEKGLEGLTIVLEKYSQTEEVAVVQQSIT